MIQPLPGIRLSWVAVGLQRDLTAAWLAVALIPFGGLSSVAATTLSRIAMGQAGVPLDQLPFVPGLVVVGVACLVFFVPCTAAWVWGRRSVAAGDPGGWAPGILGAIAAVAYLGLMLTATLVSRGI